MQLRDLFNEYTGTAQQQVIPLQTQQLLRSDLNVANDWHNAESLLLTARQQLPQQLEILVALYKLYAYSNRFSESLQIIDKTLQLAAEKTGFDSDWRRLNKNSATWYPAVGAQRIYLYTLKAAGFVNLRAGNLDLASLVLRKLEELDPSDQVGGSVVREMAERLLSCE